nr:rod shape-determining protein [Lachnospiraceae bacterium]
AALEAGARDVTLIDGPAAAALGAGIDISRACGNLVIDMGAGTTDIAVISLGMTVSSRTLKVAGNDFDDVLVRYMRREHGLMIGSQTAEEVKIRIGGVAARAKDLTMNVKGRDMTTGMPRTVEVSANETIRAFRENVRLITEGLRQVLEDTGPELSSDIAMRGILLTGGGSMLYGMDELIKETTGIQTIAIDDPISVTAIGTGRYMEFMEEKTAKM